LSAIRSRRRRRTAAVRFACMSPASRPAPPIDVSFARGKLMVHPLAPTVALAAQGRASALEWGRALLRGDPDRIEAEGDRALLDAVVLALSDAIAV